MQEANKDKVKTAINLNELKWLKIDEYAHNEKKGRWSRNKRRKVCNLKTLGKYKVKIRKKAKQNMVNKVTRKIIMIRKRVKKNQEVRKIHMMK